MKQFMFPAFLLALLIGACALLAGCSPFTFLNALAPGKGFSRQTDIAYGPLPRQKLDMYVPDEAGRNRPVLVFFMAVVGRAASAGITGSWGLNLPRAAC